MKLIEPSKSSDFWHQTYLMLVIFLIPVVCFGQQKYNGKVLDIKNNTPVKKALLNIVGPNKFIETNKSGKFSFKTDQLDYIVVTKTGYHTDTIRGFRRGNIIYLKPISPNDTIHVLTDSEIGQIKDGFKIGIWEYYDVPDKLALSIDYDKGTLLFVKKDTSMHAIEVNGEWVYSQLDIAPRYIGSFREYLQSFYQTIKYPLDARLNNTSGSFIVTFIVDLNGSATDYRVHNDIGNGCGEAVISALQSIPNFWIVAQKDQIKYKSRMAFSITFDIELNGKRVEHKKIKSKEVIPIAKLLDEMTIVAMGIRR